MSAGTRHPALGEERLLAAARGDGHRDPVHFVQMWVVPDESGIAPGYEQLEIDDELLAGGLVPVASGMAAARRRDRDPHPRTGTPRCTPPGCSPARASSCPTPRSCTCSCRAGR